ncbi:MAG: hypothetical protein Q9226_004243 [Calogaya cf. arnoldii]
MPPTTDTIDPMDIDREDSPATVLGDGSPRLTPFSPPSDRNVIEEAPRRSGGFDADDYLTDEQFNECFLNPPSGHSEPQNLTPQGAAMRSVDSWSVEGKTYRKGKTVEL